MSHIGLIASDEQVHAHSGAAASREMWQAVLHRAFLDATYDGYARADKMEQITAYRWIRHCGKDFRHVCDLAGMDADFLSNAYRSGRVDRHLLKGSEDSRRNITELPRGEISRRVMAAMQGEMTTRQIADKVRANGADLTTDQVAYCLRGQLKRRGKVTSRAVGSLYRWSLTEKGASLSREPHVSCKDRIAAAKAEVGA